MKETTIGELFDHYKPEIELLAVMEECEWALICKVLLLEWDTKLITLSKDTVQAVENLMLYLDNESMYSDSDKKVVH